MRKSLKINHIYCYFELSHNIYEPNLIIPLYPRLSLAIIATFRQFTAY